MKAAAGRSKAKEGRDAGEEAAREALKKLDGDGDLAFVYSSVSYDQQDLLDGINSVLDSCRIIGCSTGGEISKEGETTESISLMVIEDSDMEVSLAAGREMGDDEREAGREAAQKALEGLGYDHLHVRKLVREGSGWSNRPELDFTVLSTSLTGNCSEMMRGIMDVTGEGLQAGGGLAGDDWKLEETYVYKDEEVLEDAVVIAAINSPTKRSLGIKHGAEPTENTYQVTEADANILKGLDGRKPEEVYNDIFGEKGSNSQFIMTKPLGIEAGEEELRLRDPLDIRENGDIALAGEVKEGEVVTIMESPAESLVKAAEEAAREAYEKAGEPDEIAGVILNDCVCRWHCLENSETRNSEIEAVRKVLGQNVEVAGWYTYGEIALPRNLAGVHNQTVVVQLFTKEK